MKRFILLITVCSFIASLLQAGENAVPSKKKLIPKTSADSVQFHGYQQGFDMKLWMGNMGVFGKNYSDLESTPTGYGLTYPDSSGIELLYGGGLWIGAIVDTSSSDTVKRVKAVSTAYEGWSGPLFEFYGNPDGSDSFYVSSIDNEDGRNMRFYDDDLDGKTDEDELNGVDDDHDGKIDEDFGAVSENDVYVAYADDYNNPSVNGHIPLGIKVWQKSYAWTNRNSEPVLPLDFYIVNRGVKSLDSVYIGFMADFDIGYYQYYQINSSGFFPDTRTAYTFRRNYQSPVGLTLLEAPQPLNTLKFTFRWYPGVNSPRNDSMRYDLMASGKIDPDEYPGSSDSRVLVSVGPFLDFHFGDTLKISFAFVSGLTLEEFGNSVYHNSRKALIRYQQRYRVRPAVVSPPLRITKLHDRVILDWKWKPGDSGIDPLETWDDMDTYLDTLPPNHWRKTNPPAGHSGGGRIFEAFRIYRSESPAFNPKTFALLKQFDVADDLNVEIQTGLQYTLVDSNLNPESKHWYAVTSVSIPEFGYVIYPRITGGYDTVMEELTESYESAIKENASYVILSEKYHLHQSYPNPFNPKTTIPYYIPEATNVTIAVYDLLGRKIVELVNEVKTAGLYETEWDASGLASGVYFYKLQAGTFIDVKKMLFLR